MELKGVESYFARTTWENNCHSKRSPFDTPPSPAIASRKQDNREEAGPPRQRGPQSSFRDRTLIFSPSTFFSGREFLRSSGSLAPSPHPDPREKISAGLWFPQALLEK